MEMMKHTAEGVSGCSQRCAFFAVSNNKYDVFQSPPIMSSIQLHNPDVREPTQLQMNDGHNNASPIVRWRNWSAAVFLSVSLNMDQHAHMGENVSHAPH